MHGIHSYGRGLLLLCLSVWHGIGCAQSFNAQPCYEYWALTDQLRQNHRPDAQAWERLRQTDGYKRKNTTNWQHFVDQVCLVYTPGNEERIRQQLKTDPSLRQVVRYANEEANLRQYLTELAQLHLLDSAQAYARSLLPPNLQRCFRPPTVDLILYDYDASGNGNGIVMDLLVSYDMDRYKPGVFLGHECLHYALAYCRVKFRHFRAVNVPEHQSPFRIINGVSEEGTADLIDKPYLLFDERSPYMLRDTLLQVYNTQSTASISKLNELFEKLADEEAVSVDQASLLPVMGHIPGMYMGRIIQQQGLQPKLVRHIENPFRFFYLYNEAAKRAKQGTPLFSKKAVRFIKRLERLYFR